LALRTANQFLLQLAGMRRDTITGDDEADRTLERLRRARLTFVSNVLARGLSFVAIIVSSRMALPDLGATRFGIWMTVASVLVLLTFLDLGVGNGLVAPIAKAQAQGRQEDVPVVATRGLVITLAIGGLIAVVAVTASLIAPIAWLFPGVPSATLAEARTGLVVFSILLASAPPLGAVNRIFAGLQRGYVSNVVSATASLATIVLLIVAGMIGGRSISEYILLTFGVTQFASLATGAMLWREGVFAARVVAVSKLADYRQLLAAGGMFFGLQIAVMLGWGLDQPLISALLGPAEVAGYAVALRLFMTISQPLYILNMPLWPTYSDAHARGDSAYIRSAFRQSMLRTLAISIGGGLVLVLAGPWVWGVFTQHQLAYPAFMIGAFMIWTIADTMGTALAMYLNGMHFVADQLKAAMIATMLVLPLKVILIREVGSAWTVPLATAACYGLVNLVYFGLYARHRIFADLK
jgi:O-antigen/teichoic acid export membrane protein